MYVNGPLLECGCGADAPPRWDSVAVILHNMLEHRDEPHKTEVDGGGPFCKGCGADLSKESHFGACTVTIDGEKVTT